MNRQANQGGGFSSHCFFRSRRRRNDTVRALDYAFAVARGRDRRPCALGAPRLVSTPSPRALHREAWLGVASMRASGVSPNLKGSAPAVSDRALNLLSPLCLPISSPRQQGGAHSTIGRAPHTAGMPPGGPAPTRERAVQPSSPCATQSVAATVQRHDTGAAEPDVVLQRDARAVDLPRPRVAA